MNIIIIMIQIINIKKEGKILITLMTMIDKELIIIKMLIKEITIKEINNIIAKIIEIILGIIEMIEDIKIKIINNKIIIIKVIIMMAIIKINIKEIKETINIIIMVTIIIIMENTEIRHNLIF